MNYRTERWPVVTFSLLGLNTLVWLVSLICSLNTSGESDDWIYTHLWLVPGQFVWYTHFTSMFIHAGIFHFLGNMVYLFLFGCCVEDLIGRWRFLLFYLLGGLAANFVFIAATPVQFAAEVHLCGASGAIAACMGMYLMLRAGADIVFKLFYFVWLFIFRFGVVEFDMPAWMAIGLWFLSNLGSMVWRIIYPGGHGGGGTAFAAHVGGLLAGLAFIALYKLATRKSPEEIAAASTILSPQEIKAAAALNRTSSDFEIPTLYLHENGAQTGPYTLSQIQSRLAQNELDPATLYWSAGMSQWENVADLADHSSP